MTKWNAAFGLSDAQMEIMAAVWDKQGGASVADVWRAVSMNRRVARSTVQTMLVRLEERGWLTHRNEGAGFRYSARRPRRVTLRRIVAKLVETAFAGSAESMVMALLQGRRVSKEEAERIRAMIDESERRNE